jgi:endoglucanase
MSFRTRVARVAALAVATAALSASVPAALAGTAVAANGALDAVGGSQFYVPKPNHGAIEQIADLRSSGRQSDADLISQMIDTPQAVWLTGGTAKEVEQDARATAYRAAAKKTVPVLVAYNIPYRDCAQFSAGGATNTAEYKAWIDGLAAGIVDYPAVVILEPDGLGIIPYYTPLFGPMEWCQPTVDGAPAPEADPAHRFEQLNYAVDRLGSLPNASVYLDGTHARWLGVGEAADRLIKAGVLRARGFFLNVSNYQTTAESEIYGRWVSGCIAGATNPASWAFAHPDFCPGQYAPPDFSCCNYTPEYVASVDATYASMGVPSTAHFVIDTSRNGQGRWIPPAIPPGSFGTDPQDWCNPPDRGLGVRPTAATGVPLLDAYLWIKIPGESDGQCNRWDPPGSPDPVRGLMDPPAGQWFRDMALELVHNANPPL